MRFSSGKSYNKTKKTPKPSGRTTTVGKQKTKIGTAKRNNRSITGMFKINRRANDDMGSDMNHIQLDAPATTKRSKDDTEKPNRKK